jgi:hypothetical protein
MEVLRRWDTSLTDQNDLPLLYRWSVQLNGILKGLASQIGVESSHRMPNIVPIIQYGLPLEWEEGYPQLFAFVEDLTKLETGPVSGTSIIKRTWRQNNGHNNAVTVSSPKERMAFDPEARSVKLDGIEFYNVPDDAYELLRACWEAYPEFVHASKIGNGIAPYRVRKGLHPKLNAVLVSERVKGCRLIL